MKLIDLTGNQYGRLTILGRHPASSNNGPKWNCVCTCGNTTTVWGGNLRSGTTKSCGCLLTESINDPDNHPKKHGLHKSREYQAYHDMIQRCYNPKCISYRRYGGRGITVCDRWIESFENFYEDMGKRPSPHHSLDREDNDGHYIPNNCRWTTKEIQDNNKSTNQTYLVDNVLMTIAQIARKHNVPRHQLTARISKGDTLEQALSTERRYKPMHQYCLDGVSKSLKEWGLQYNLPYRKLWKRVNECNMSLEQALNYQR